MTARIVVAGGRPAGLSAAIAAASHGAAVALFDEAPVLGGQLTYRLVDDAPALRTRLRDDALNAGVEIESNAIVWGLFGGNEATVSRGGSSRRIVFDRAILATGSTDRVVSFAGSSLPGVLTARALQILMHRHRVLPGKNVAVIGGHGDEICRDVELSGGAIVVRDAGGDLDGVAARGAKGVERLTIAGVEREVDLIVLAFGAIPDPRLAIMAECAVTPGDSAGAYVPVRDVNLRTSNPAIYAAGDIAGSGRINDSVAEGRLAGLAAAASLGLVSEDELERERQRFALKAPGRNRAVDAAGFVQYAGQGAWL